MIVLAGLLIEIVGSHPVVGLVNDEFRTAILPAEHVGHLPRVVVEVLEGRLSTEGVSVGSASVERDRLVLDYPRAGLQVGMSQAFLAASSGAGSGPDVMVAIRPKPVPLGAPRWAYRYLEPTFLDPEQVQGYLFIREVLESIVALRGPAAPLHAAAVAHDGRAVVLASGGGVGKTSTAMALLSGGRWRSMADDIVFVEPGVVHPNPRRAMVYRYNLSDPGVRQKFLSHLSTVSRLHFTLEEKLTPTRARRRMSAEELWGTEVQADGTRLGTAVALVRRHGPTQVRTLEPSEMAARSTAITRNEFASLFARLNEAAAAGFEPALVERTLERHSATLEASFAAADECIELAIGPNTSPSEVAALVEGRAGGIG